MIGVMQHFVTNGFLENFAVEIVVEQFNKKKNTHKLFSILGKGRLQILLEKSLCMKNAREKHFQFILFLFSFCFFPCFSFFFFFYSNHVDRQHDEEKDDDLITFQWSSETLKRKNDENGLSSAFYGEKLGDLNENKLISHNFTFNSFVFLCFLSFFPTFFMLKMNCLMKIITNKGNQLKNLQKLWQFCNPPKLARL